MFYVFYHFIYSMWGSGILQIRIRNQVFLLKSDANLDRFILNLFILLPNYLFFQ